MNKIVTVLGDLAPDMLGTCQSHEHLWIESGRSCEINPILRIDSPAGSRRELELYREAGGKAVVDAQPLGCGRDPERLAQLSRESGVHIIASTGFHRPMFYDDAHWLVTCDADWLTRLYLEELQKGMYGLCDTAPPARRTEARAGQIKAALDGPVTGLREKLFTAAADAAAQTAAPLMVHIEKDADPVALAAFLERRKVRPDQMIFCHMDRSVADLSVHKELCRLGIYLEYDTIARPKYHDDAREAEIILEMLEAGCEKQLLLSLDVTRARLISYGGTVGLPYLLRVFVPLLRDRGVSARQILSFLVDNPAAVFAR